MHGVKNTPVIAEVKRLRKKLDLTGEFFGSLQVEKDMGKNRFGQSLWLCECSCGNQITVPLCRLRSANLKSCGRCKPNTYETREGLIFVTVADGRSFVIDEQDFPVIAKRSWHITAQGYVATDIDRKLVKLHNMLLNPAGTELVDHINRNKLDNRRENLRKCTKQQNCFNQSLRCTNSSGFKGVVFDKRRNVYYSRIMHNGITHHLGTFKTDDIVSAAKAYNQKALELFGEYAFLNSV